MVRKAIPQVTACGLRPLESCVLKFNGRSFLSSGVYKEVTFSGTSGKRSNVADTIQAVGKDVFILKKDQLIYTRATKSGHGGKVVSNLTLPFSAEAMLFDSKSASLIVIGKEFKMRTTLRSPTLPDDYQPYPLSRPVTKLVRISVKNPQNMKIIDRSAIQGQYISARLINGAARIFLTYDASEQMSFTTVASEGNQTIAERKNLKIVKNSKISDWLPTYSSNGMDCRKKKCKKYAVKNKLLVKCKSAYFPEGELPGFTSVVAATINMSGPLLLKGVFIAADDIHRIYATDKSIYTASIREAKETNETKSQSSFRYKSTIHKLTFHRNNLGYIGSTEDNGDLIDKFSMHEYKGTLFVATSERFQAAKRSIYRSKISAFRIRSNRLVKVGKIGGLFKHRHIDTVQFFDSTAYVISSGSAAETRIVDLSNAYKPKAFGTMRLGGYNSYVYQIAPDRVITVGGIKRHKDSFSKLALLDISNLAKPIQLSSWIMEKGEGFRNLEYYPFLWSESQNLLFVPTWLRLRCRPSTIGLAVFEVSRKMVRERGKIIHGCSGRSSDNDVEKVLNVGNSGIWSLSADALQINGVRKLDVKEVLPLTDSS